METQKQQKISQSALMATQSPSFTSYSSEHLADIAARVVNELNLNPHNNTDPFDDDFYSSFPQNDAFQSQPQFEFSQNQNDTVEDGHDNNNDDDDRDSDSEFEFVVLCGEQNTSPISADEIFDNGQIKPIYPLFNTDLVYGNQNDTVEENPSKTIRWPLRKLMIEERETSATSCSSSEAGDDLEGVPEGTYCVWAPTSKKNNSQSQNDDGLMRKKSKSTGSNPSSKRWRFRDLLHRSNSDGKETFVFLTAPAGNGQRREKMGDGKKRRESGTGGLEGRKKTYLPYRQDLVGLFANANGISRTIRPF